MCNLNASNADFGYARQVNRDGMPDCLVDSLPAYLAVAGGVVVGLGRVHQLFYQRRNVVLEDTEFGRLHHNALAGIDHVVKKRKKSFKRLHANLRLRSGMINAHLLILRIEPKCRRNIRQNPIKPDIK